HFSFFRPINEPSHDAWQRCAGSNRIERNTAVNSCGITQLIVQPAAAFLEKQLWVPHNGNTMALLECWYLADSKYFVI
ncbi:hypothetical protein, partial [Pseudoglutamicibacter cumminsii]|uniref:hypothetical protein n=1 Tax=Pseudoglutamicibacter cumminsii TaxID=156979 RepID=UPI001C63564E